MGRRGAGSLCCRMLQVTCCLLTAGHAATASAGHCLPASRLLPSPTTCRPTGSPTPTQGQEPAIPAAKHSEDERLAPLRALLSSRAEAPPAEEVQALSATQLRDALLALGPLDCEWVKKVNAAEAEYWKRW